eukprot:TRINITY_DN3370_c0_g1_i2.p1 TRINITY_DN3370_c0_g1~~TRINITY_DN3370_c0_g1_i2.p1  ORF type:complete len:249 (+),score=95.54 TRINITY_DN3370_c0_g1_i2:91-837(+)
MFVARTFFRTQTPSPLVPKPIVSSFRPSSSSSSKKKVAVVLSGCGVFDGTEIIEAVSVTVHLSQLGAEATFFAPNIKQYHVINHAQGKEEQSARNVLVESARIARGEVSELSELKATNFNAVIFPGGFGAAKNLSTFAMDGSGMKVNKDVQRVLEEFNAAKKPIGLCCIAPVLAAKVLPGVTVTVGSDENVATQIQALNSKAVEKKVTEIVYDEKFGVVTTPAFMCNAPSHEVFQGIGSMVKKVVELA